MKIVHFSAGRINPSAAKIGLVNVLYWVAREQARHGHEVTTIVMPENLDYENVSEDSFRIVEYARSTRGGFVLDPKLLEDIDNGRLKIDIAHLHGFWSPTMAAVGRALRKRRIPYVVSSHGSFSPMILKKQPILKHAFRRIFALPLLNRARFVHVHAAGEVQDAESFGVRAKIVVAEQGIDMSAIPAHPARDWFHKRFPQYDNTFKILFLGRLDPWHKGIDLLLRAMAIALRTDPDLTLFLVGPEKRRYRTEIPELIAQLGIARHVVMPGPLYDPLEKYGALSSADCFVLTSRFEALALTVLEAMACGTPVVVTPGTNAGEIVQSGRAGKVCKPDPEEIARALLEMRLDQSELAAMRDRAQLAAAPYTSARMASVLTNAYEDALRGQLLTCQINRK